MRTLFSKIGEKLSKFIASFFAFLIIFLVTACGGGGGSTNNPPPPLPPSTYTMNGVVSGAVQSGVTILVTPGNIPALTSANGGFSLSGFTNGTYTATPSLVGYTFTPTSTSVVVNGANVTGVNFTATAIPPATYLVSGKVSGAVASGVSISLSGYTPVVTSTDGSFTYTGVANGTYTATPSLVGYTFTPTSTSVVVNGANVTGVNFTATIVPPSLHSISGVATKAGTVGVLSGVTVTLTLGSSSTATDVVGITAFTGTNGIFTFTGVANGTYTATPALSGFTFTPTSTSVVVNGADVANVNFAATAIPSNAYSLYWMRITPNAVFDDEFATKPITMEASISGTGFTPYVEGGSPAIFDKTLPITGVKAVMLDTGIVDSYNPGARIYRATLVPGFTPRLRFYENTVDASTFGVTAYDSITGNRVSPANSIIQSVDLGIVSRTLAVSTTQVASDVFAASNMVNIVIPDFNRNDIETAAMKKVYQYYPDVFSIAVLQQVGRTTGGNIPSGGYVKNTTLGINVPLMDNSSGFGSNSVLSSVIYETTSDIINAAFLHEHGHSAANYLNLPTLNLTDETKFHTASYSTVVGQMGNGYFLQEQSNGDFLVTVPDSVYGYDSRKYADLELYLLGLIPASAVQSMRFILDSTVTMTTYKTGDIIPRAKTTLVTIDDIIRVYGARTPSSLNSQKSFQTLFVGISEQPMTVAEIALVNRIATYYASDALGGEIDTKGIFSVRSAPSFKAATNGIGTLVTAVPPRK